MPEGQINSPVPATDGRSGYKPRNPRRILCVFPRYAPSFGTFQYSFKLLDVKAFMPPQGLLLITAYLPAEWEVRFIDENLEPASDADFAWADAVFTSGMHVQRRYIEEIVERAHRFGKVAVLGGPSVSGCPEYYPEADILHIGEIGDATDKIIQYLDEGPRRPPAQMRLVTADRLALDAFPSPAYDRVDLSEYFLGSVQYSSGCPYRCEFCDIPALYGRNPRLKTPGQLLRELGAILANGAAGPVYFVDDNFIGNAKATRAMLPPLIEYQKANGYPLRLSCEATLNLAQNPDILAEMREAAFDTIFVGIETPEEDALTAMLKKQNLRQPILEAIHALNGFGMEVVSGIIMGLDTDTPNTGRNIMKFVEASNIPMLTINLLYALPKTALYDRLEKDGRLLSGGNLMSNVLFKLPYDDTVRMWKECITEAYAPEAIFRRFIYQTEHTYPNRLKVRRKAGWKELKMGLGVIRRVLWHVGLRADYRHEFWKAVMPLLRQGRVEEVIHIAVVTYHLIHFARDISEGRMEAAFYADPSKTPDAAPVTAHRAAQAA
ncbi:MAG: B12-binding domain-containing radical SAM protein [Rhodospirillales bacterium]